jgi:hypothetical protein
MTGGALGSPIDILLNHDGPGEPCPVRETLRAAAKVRSTLHGVPEGMAGRRRRGDE